MHWVEFLLVAAATFGAAALTMVVTTLVAIRRQRAAVVDVAWGLGFVLMAVVAAVLGSLTEADWRRWLLLALVAVWGGRLGWHIRRQAVGKGEDPRYEELLGGTIGAVGVRRAVRKVFGIQGAAMWFVCLPVVAGATHPTRWWGVVAVGVALWAVGLLFEAVGDAQLAAYKRLPAAQKPPVMERGLWRYTRHPNYFGDACVWWGLWLAGGLASGWLPGLVTVLCPVAMTYFLVHATGARLLEKTMMRRPGYPEYAARTSMFFPLPPKRA